MITNLINMNNLFFSEISCWAPFLYDDEQLWKKWANCQNNEIEIPKTNESPKLEYTTPLFRRRLSQITKMTVHVIHNLLEKSNIDKNTKIVFVSFRGEIERQFSINDSIINEQTILPASFSLSVFNTPISCASLAFGLKGGYSVIFPSKNNFKDVFITASSPILAKTEEKIIFVYADELIPKVYGKKLCKNEKPFAFAGILSREKINKSVKLDDFSKISSTPEDFLRFLIKNQN